MKYQAIVLNRVSSKDQLSGHSLDAQLKNAEDKARELGVDIAKVWSGVLSSNKGKNLGRKDLEEMLTLCKRNKQVKYLLVDMVNRLMREMKVMVYYMVRFEELGVKIVFCDPSQQHLNSDDQMAQLMVVIEGFKAEADNKSRCETSISRMHSRIKQGYYLSHPHQGYMKSNVPGLHIPDPVRFNPLQQACHHIIYHGYSVTQAIKWLNDSGYRTRAGRKMSIDHFIDLLMDRYYCGFIDITSDGWPKDIKGLHQRMLSVREHKLLLTIFRKRNPRVRLKHNPDFPMSNILRHHDCIKGKTDKFTGHNKHRGYRSGRLRPKAPVYDCRGCRQCIGRDKAHQALSAYFSTLHFKPSDEQFRKILIKVWGLQRGSSSEQINILSRRKSQCEQQLQEATNKYIGAPTAVIEQSISKFMDELSLEIKQIETEILQLENIDLESEDFVSWAFEYVKSLPDSWWTLSPEDRMRGEQILFNGKLYMDNTATVHSPTLSSIYRLGSNKKAPEFTSNAFLEELPATAAGSNGLAS